ncbi:hypothetical protein SISNIDRAFT_471595 [Sistotremastrum niveocremeum HHB9708]|uniref:WD40 repeat-like protein n=1 Tax=Sistotremastrum niveocremeum HHB9708 TaxID=1314777 RepID=A0A164MFL2_9AGAM|nr:hypothetical protein SISNIDRAFT_471595 [Sistotremastrum niveocremeum HHB9708]
MLSYTLDVVLKNPTVTNVPIHAMNFRPDGLQLAGLQTCNVICLWTLKDNDIHEISTNAEPLSLLWIDHHGGRPFELLCGLRDGALISLRSDQEFMTLEGFAGLSTEPARYMDFSSGDLAVAGNHTVSIWTSDKSDKQAAWSCKYEFQVHAFESGLSNEPVEITSVHWLQNQSFHGLLIARRHHGVSLWDAKERRMTTVFNIPQPCSSLSLSPDQTSVIISNARRSYLKYSLLAIDHRHQTLQRGNDVSVPASAQAVFVHGGKACIGGFIDGEICLWNAESGEFLQSFGKARAYNRQLGCHISIWRPVKEVTDAPAIEVEWDGPRGGIILGRVPQILSHLQTYTGDSKVARYVDHWVGKR